jgi:hypothetical protein
VLGVDAHHSEEKSNDTDPEILVGCVTEKVGRRHASGVAGMADSLLWLWGVSLGVGRWRHPLEGSFRWQADAGALFSLSRPSPGSH